MAIKVKYSSVDGCGIRRTFNQIENARAFAHRYVGATPEMGRTYAISGDGVGKIECDGCTLHDLFPEA